MALGAGLALRFLAPYPFSFTFVASDPHTRRYWWPVISGALLILSSSVLWPTTSCFYLLLQTMHSFLSIYFGTFGRLRYLPNSTFFVLGSLDGSLRLAPFSVVLRMLVSKWRLFSVPPTMYVGFKGLILIIWLTSPRRLN